MTEGNFTYETEKVSAHGKSAGKHAGSDDLQVVITGLVQERRDVEIPEKLGGLPVRAIAPHALAEQALMRSLILPPTLHSIGAFAFHNCPQLEEISLHDSIRDFHNGVVRQDRMLRRIRMTVHEGNYTVMRDILSDTDAKLQFCLQLPDGEVHLLFPGYDYAFNENTMARTIQFSISGSGMVYREVVRRKGIGFREYDRLFARVIPDDPHAASQIAADRLLFPYDLADVHAAAYEDYLRENARESLLYFVRQLKAGSGTEASDEAYMRLRLMAQRGLVTAEAADDALRLASDLRLTEACSLIMSGREAFFQKPETSLDDGWEELSVAEAQPGPAPYAAASTEAAGRQSEESPAVFSDQSGQRKEETFDEDMLSLDDW